MLQGLRAHLTYANAMATIAVFIALGAGAYAAGLAPNSVKSKQIAPDAAKGVDIDEGTLNEVPSAQDAETLDGKFSGDFQKVRRVQAGDWQPLTLFGGAPEMCSWHNYGNGFADASYLLDQDGFVHLRGLIYAADGSVDDCGDHPEDAVIGKLPEDFNATSSLAPDHQSLFTISSNNKPGRLNVSNLGAIYLEPGYPTYADAKAWVQLDGLSWPCGLPGVGACS